MIFSSIVGFTVAVLLLWRLIPVAANIGLIDHPNARKDHPYPTPNGVRFTFQSKQVGSP